MLQVVPSLDVGGVERGTAEIAEAILAQGGRAIIASEGGRLAYRIRRAGGEIVEMGASSKNPLDIWQNARALAALIRAANVDIVHARSRAPGWSAYLACRWTGTPFVTTYHGTYNEGVPFKRLYNSVMARGRPVIAISDFIRELIIERHHVAPSDIVTIPRGADVTVFSEDVVGNARTIALAENWRLIEDTRPIIMLPGRLTRWKGAETLIEAVARLRERAPDLHFVALLVGSDGGSGFGRQLERMIAGKALEDYIYMVGECADMPAAYKLASVVVSASLEPEAFGRVAVEAQAMGRPVIATDHGGARETVEPGVTGWLYPPGDAEALANAIAEALAIDPTERAHIGLAGRAHVHAKFTTAAMQRATLRLYEEVAGRTFRPTI